MISRTTTASQGVLCPSVYGLVCRTFAMSIILPVIRLRWPRSALQSPFEVSFATAPAVACTALDTRRMRWPPHRRRCALFRAPGRPNAEKRIIPASMLLAPYFLPSCFCSGLLVVIGAATEERCNRTNREDGQAPTHRASDCKRKHVSLLFGIVC